MATLAESVIGAAQSQAQNGGKSVGDAVQAYHIAATAEHARQELDMQKQDNAIKKSQFLLDGISRANSMTGPMQKEYLSQFGERIKQIDPTIDTSGFQSLVKSPEDIQKVLAGVKTMQDTGGVQNPDQASYVTGMFGFDGAAKFISDYEEHKAKIQAAQLGMAQTRMQMLEETKRQHALQFSERATNDKIIGMSKMNLNSLYRSENILGNPNLPVTAKDLNLAYNDYINAVAAGGAATEGKIARELPDTWVQSFNELQQKAGKNADLRKTQAGKALIDQLSGRITGVKSDISDAIASQATIYHDMGINSGNPNVAEAAKGILMQYAPKAYAAKYGKGGGKTAQAPPNPTPYGSTPDEIEKNYEMFKAQQAHQQAGGE